MRAQGKAILRNFVPQIEVVIPGCDARLLQQVSQSPSFFQAKISSSGSHYYRMATLPPVIMGPKYGINAIL